MAGIYEHIKTLVPNSWKYPLWYLFKAPQRRFGVSTVFNDLAGVFIHLFSPLLPAPPLKKISICTGLYNRSDMYLDTVVKSLQHLKHKDKIELSVFDCGSNDRNDLRTEIVKRWTGELVFDSVPVPFTRAVAFNKAVAQASAEIVFICDADMLIPENIVELCNRFTAKKRAWYPIVFTLYKDKPEVIAKENGFWMVYSGKGMLVCRKADYMAAGGLDEKFTQWGAEDDDLWERFVKAGFTIVRNRQKGLIHRWHPSFNPRAAT